MKARQIDILKQPIPTLLVTFLLLVTVQALRAMQHPYPAENIAESLSPLGRLIDTSLEGVAGVVVTLIATLFTSILITRTISRYALSVIRSFVPMVLLSIGVCGILFPIGSPALALSVAMIAKATELMIMSFKRTERFGEVMMAAFWTGTVALIIPDLVWIVALLPIQWLIWQRSPREMVAGVIMTMLPLLLASCGWWFAGKPFGMFAKAWCATLPPFEVMDFEAAYHQMGGILPTLLLATILLLTLASIVASFGAFGSMRVRARKGHLYFSLLYILGVVMMFLLGTPAAVAVAVMGFASVPLIHTFFVRHKGVAIAAIYALVLLLTILTAAAPIWGLF